MGEDDDGEGEGEVENFRKHVGLPLARRAGVAVILIQDEKNCCVIQGRYGRMSSSLDCQTKGSVCDERLLSFTEGKICDLNYSIVGKRKELSAGGHRS